MNQFQPYLPKPLRSLYEVHYNTHQYFNAIHKL